MRRELESSLWPPLLAKLSLVATGQAVACLLLRPLAGGLPQSGIGHFAGWSRGEGYGGRIISFEPVAEAFTELQRHAAADPSWSCVNVALTERDGEAVINVAGNLWSSSLLR